jgi:hypothetical protein
MNHLRGLSLSLSLSLRLSLSFFLIVSFHKWRQCRVVVAAANVVASRWWWRAGWLHRQWMGWWAGWLWWGVCWSECRVSTLAHDAF